jgi:hypothetical protein
LRPKRRGQPSSIRHSTDFQFKHLNQIGRVCHQSAKVRGVAAAKLNRLGIG